VELEKDFNEDGYWGPIVHATQAYVLSTIASFTKFEASKSTPQYGFNRGMKEFGELGFETTMKELDDNLIGMGAVQMLDTSEVIKEVWTSTLSYLIFLKRNEVAFSSWNVVFLWSSLSLSHSLSASLLRTTSIFLAGVPCSCVQSSLSLSLVRISLLQVMYVVVGASCLFVCLLENSLLFLESCVLVVERLSLSL
jgi:hypothetical protein